MQVKVRLRPASPKRPPCQRLPLTRISCPHWLRLQQRLNKHLPCSLPRQMQQGSLTKGRGQAYVMRHFRHSRRSSKVATKMQWRNATRSLAGSTVLDQGQEQQGRLLLQLPRR